MHLDFAGIARPSSCEDRFAYPYWTALALAPIGAMPLEAAASTWAALAVTATALGAALSWIAVGGGRRSFPLFAVVTLFSQPFWLLLVGGQVTGLLLLALGAAGAALRSRRDLVAGAWLAALAVKPQLASIAGLVALRALFDRRPALVVSGGGVVAVLVLASLVLLPTWPTSWLAGVAELRLTLTRGIATAWGLGLELGGSLLGAPLALLALAAYGIAMRVLRPSVVHDTALAVPVALFVAPHAWSYDHLLLVLPWAATLSVADRLTQAARMLVLVLSVAAASLLPWSLYAIAFARERETLSALVPVATFLLLAWALRLDARQRDTTGG